MFTRQTMETMGKFVLLCSHFDSVFLKLFVSFFYHPVVALGVCGDAGGLPECTVGLWKPGI